MAREVTGADVARVQEWLRQRRAVAVSADEARAVVVAAIAGRRIVVAGEDVLTRATTHVQVAPHELRGVLGLA